MTTDRHPSLGDQPDPDRLRDAVGSEFVVAVDGGPAVALTLAAVDRHSVGSGVEAFSLLFRGTRPAAFRQGTFPVQHPAHGSFPLFLVAVQGRGAEQNYEAVFTRTVE